MEVTTADPFAEKAKSRFLYLEACPITVFIAPAVLSKFAVFAPSTVPKRSMPLWNTLIILSVAVLSSIARAVLLAVVGRTYFNTIVPSVWL